MNINFDHYCVLSEKERKNLNNILCVCVCVSISMHTHTYTPIVDLSETGFLMLSVLGGDPNVLHIWKVPETYNTV